MDNKKHFSSLLEDHSPRPSTSALRPLSPFRTGRRSMTRGQDQSVLSCVTKETPQEDCARHRFIVWAAVKRNSSVRMTPEERLECPLLRCTQRFHDHEAMLKHLAACRYLAFGEYWCYDHMRVERFDDMKCKKCLGHPSKRRKMLYMAKTFFHSLGHKSKKTQGAGLDDDEVMMPPPPSYDSLNIPTLNATASELPSTEILEIDSMEIPLIQPTPAPAPSDAIDPQALLMPVMPPMPSMPELDSTMLSADFMQWPIPGFTPVMAPEDIIRTPMAKPTLQLTTAGLQGRRQPPRPVSRAAPTVPRSKGLSPSSSVRSTASTDTTVSTCSNGSSMISPSSNWSGTWSTNGMNTGMSSPIDGVDFEDMFAEYTNNNTYANETCPENLHDFFSELPADYPMLQDTSAMPSNDLLGFEAPLANMQQYTPNIVLTDEAAQTVEINEPEVEETNTCCSEAKSLVRSAWDALQQHIDSSKEKIQDHRDNPLAGQLRTMSDRTVATTGLRTLRSLITGQQPSSASDALCLIHLVYAFSLVSDEQVSSDRVNSLFVQSQSYANGLQPNDRNLYQQLVMSIWQPPDLTHADINNQLTALSGHSFAFSEPKGKAVLGTHGHIHDPVLDAARDFLDGEYSTKTLVLNADSPPLTVQISDLHMTHLKDMSPAVSTHGTLATTARYVLEMLAQRFGEAGLHSRLKGISQRLGNGSLCSVRKIELEILDAGRNSLPSARFFGSYVPNARKLCDQMYEQHDAGTLRRDHYHGLGLALIESLISELDNSNLTAAPSAMDDLDAFFDNLNSGASNQLTAFPQPSNEQQQPNHQKPVEANASCHICGYRPKGDPQWFKGSMAKHMKTMHSGAPDKIYKCPFPGCEPVQEQGG
ncbi:hypothetical protein N0V88_003215 [Collariella sp. IMI 366227]|nr:hypothetical protein N0V88_003215 [Collariella sp. IMI 366227]